MKMSKVFDCHLHIEDGLVNYDLDLDGANVIFNEVESWNRNKHLLQDNQSVSLILDYKNNFNSVVNAVKNNEINALKIHSRKQGIGPKEWGALMDALDSINNTKIPIIYDAFYVGKPLEFQPSLELAEALAKRGNPIIIAHSGGYEILRYFLHLRNYDNVNFDLSVTPVYLKTSSVFLDFNHMIKHSDPNKIMFGSDYPLIKPKLAYDIILEVLNNNQYTLEQIENVMYWNAKNLFLTPNENTI
jgi:predicted TIM-barrel fold metal-dependent hydrolase